MAIRQYIGARYVPRFMGTYNASQQYEVLDVVDNGAGTSYILKKPAPVGTPVTNTTYWAIYGATSGAIIHLQDQIDDMNDGTVEGSLQNQIDEIRDIKQRHIIIIGDSYERVTSFGSSVSDYLGHGNTTFISTNVQKSADGFVYVASRGGSGFTNDGGGKSSGNGFLNMIMEVVANTTIDERRKIDTIIIAGGVNDSFYNMGDPDLALLPQRMADFNSYVKSYFVNAQVELFFLGRVRQLDTHTGLNPKDIRFNVYRYVDVAGTLGWGFITNSEYVCFIRENFIGTDNLHPRPQEGTIIARYIVEGLCCGSVNVMWVENPIYSITLTNDFVSSPMQMGCNLTNNRKTVRLAANFEANPAVGTSITLVRGVQYKIGTQDAFFANTQIDVPIALNIWDIANNSFKMMNAMLRFYGYDVYLVNYGCESNGANVTTNGIVGPSNIEFNVDTMWT